MKPLSFEKITLGLAVSLLGITTSTASAQDPNFPNFRAGVVNVKEVQALPNGDARHIFEVRQQLEGANPKVLGFSGGSISGNVTTDDPTDIVLDLTGEVYANKKFDAIGGSSKSSLTPAVVQDSSLGCRSGGFGVLDRIASLENKSTSSADFSVGSYFHIVDNRVAGLVNGARPVQSQMYPAPNYTGPLYYEMTIDGVGSIDLKPYIIAPEGFTCKLKEDKNVHGIANTGLARNPAGLTITEDCIVKWNTNGTQLGEKYGFRTVIYSAYSDPSCGKAYTELDLLLQVGCAAHDLACLQCSNIDVRQILADTQKAYDDITNLWEKSIKQIGKLRTKFARDPRSKEFQSRTYYRRLVNQFAAKRLVGKQTIDANLSSQPQFIMNCLRPSKLFCQSKDMSSIVAPTLNAINEAEKGSKKSERSLSRLQKILTSPGFKGRSSRQDLKASRAKIQNITVTAQKARDAISLLNGTVNQCE